MKGSPLVERCVVSTFLFACVPMANAVTQDISAVFRPDPSKPQEAAFLNTTPMSGYCAELPSQCQMWKMFSVRLPLSVNSIRAIQAGHTDPRQGAMFQVPANWRTAQIVHSGTGETEIVQVRWVGIGSRYQFPGSVVDLVGGGVDPGTAHTKLWTDNWGYPPTGCHWSGFGRFGENYYEFFWRTPMETVCAKKAQYLIPSMAYSYVDFAYELRMPNPMRMTAGQYTGDVTIGIGPGRELDMGDVMLPNDSALTLNFKLDVEHAFKVEIPPGGNRVELVPSEGWQAWLNSGHKPTRLFREQRFHISTSSRFKMALECQYISGNTCAISEAGSGHAVPVDVRVSLPDGLTDFAGQPVNRRRLLRDGSGTELFLPNVYVDRQPGNLSFEIAQASVEEMLDGGARTYIGNITVIWDSEV
ncbi:hypothetical protein QMK47_23260 [Pseudomonas sp. P9_35]|uniref:hypothetical protein n=1 Tax=unclassified Pseudomonas TaxID=196821 RepID=UPI00215FA712|nr:MULTISPECIES: hypothetical protein [unclassified Pseudomonas]UVM60322.1 hypothetical protein LOY50_22710 [Pseudomonas sp. B21-010]WPN62416.1 hypothetical protein QMK48_22365 [Pseudomonas sp. P9_32]WPN68170.1 hypothetical protein QMK47_23260 [Pseudomonas sp. P9_35]